MCTPHAHFDAPFRIGLPMYDKWFTITSACVEFFIPLSCIIYWNIQVYRKIKHQATRVAASLVVATFPLQQQHWVGNPGTLLGLPAQEREAPIELSPKGSHDMIVESASRDTGIYSSTKVIIQQADRLHPDRRSSYAIMHNVTLDVHVLHALRQVSLDRPIIDLHSKIEAECSIKVKCLDKPGRNDQKKRSRSGTSKSKGKSKGKYAGRYSVESLELSSGFSCTSLGRKVSLEEMSRELACTSSRASELNELDNDIEEVLSGFNNEKMEDGLNVDAKGVKKKGKGKSLAKGEGRTLAKKSSKMKTGNEIVKKDSTTSSGIDVKAFKETDLDSLEKDLLEDKIDETKRNAEEDKRKLNNFKPVPTVNIKEDSTKTLVSIPPSIPEVAENIESLPENQLATTNPKPVHAANDKAHPPLATTTSNTSTEPNYARKNMQRAGFILVVITLVFIVCRTPYVVGRLMAIACSTCIEDVIYQSMFWLGWGLALINPFLYAFISVAFRKYCVAKFMKWKNRCCRCFK